MDHLPKYENYSYEELLSARQAIDAEAHPERTRALDELLASHAQKNQPKDAISDKIIRTGKGRFLGNGKEYFSIWIVNLLLTIVTFGIYSAWAKVRNNRYIYGNTEIDGHRFHYLADPVQILIGRIIAIVFFALYFLASNFSPMAFGIMTVALLLLSPYFALMSLRFNMKMTGYRNIRFRFDGTYGGAFVYFMLYPFLTIFTLYLALPLAMKKMDQYIIDHTRYGDPEFISNTKTGEYYIAGFVASILASIVFILSMAALGINFADVNDVQQQAEGGLITIALPFIYLAVYLLSSSYYQAHIRNHIFNHSEIEQVASFKSSVAFIDLFIIKFTNILAIIVTLGLAIPWAKVRMTRYLAEATEVSVTAQADSIIASSDNEGNAIGDEVASAFDVDVALG